MNQLGSIRLTRVPQCTSSFGTASHDLHRIRRRAIEKFFSRQQMLKMEPEIHGLTQRLCDKILRTTGEVLDVRTAYSCLVSDVISAYCFGEPLGFVDQVCANNSPLPPFPSILAQHYA